MSARGKSDPAALRARAAQLRAAADAAEARARKRERADDLRRRVLLGAWVLARMGPDLAKWPEASRAALDAYLTRPHDRAAFGLPPLPLVPAEPRSGDPPGEAG